MNKGLAMVASGFTLALSADPVPASCGSAFCTINTNWGVQGQWTEPGIRADLRYEYINQDQPMNGKDKVSVGQIPMHHDEVHTVNKNWIATFDYQFDSAWGISAVIPVVDRDHLHIHNHQGAQIPESWNFTQLGDVRVLARYQFPGREGTDHTLTSSGMIFGLKLPTGKFDVTNAEGEQAERPLQPGSGTTDLVFGVYLQGNLPLKDFSWFTQAQYVGALNMREEFRPGDRFTIDLGVRYDISNLGLMLQLNALSKAKDLGAQAETDDSGGTFVFVSPGISYSITRNLQAYGFVQFPVYQYVNGVQLTANRAVALGISGRF